MTEYTFWVMLVCTDKNIGNALAGIAASFPTDPGAEQGTFTDARMVALTGAPAAPVAWYTLLRAKAPMASVVEALKAGAEYSDERLAYLRERGMTSEQWAAAGAVFPVRDVYQGEFQPDAMANLAAANGYAVIEPVEEQP